MSFAVTFTSTTLKLRESVGLVSSYSFAIQFTAHTFNDGYCDTCWPHLAWERH